MKNIPNPKIWFLTGSQHLYGEEPLRRVAENSKTIVDQLNASGRLPLRLVFKPVLTRPEDIRATLIEANGAPDCAGVITWCHTFSPSKMWINGLLQLRKPLLHLATQFNRDLPWAEIDMDFMNLNQAAHGDREHGFIHARLRLPRKVVVGHWSDGEVQDRVAAWMRVTRAWADWQKGRYVRFGDNMRQVAVTDGDKVAAEARFGFSVNTHGVGDLVAVMEAVNDASINTLCAEYEATYEVAPALRKAGDRHAILRYNARQEIGLRSFLEEGGFTGFSDTFEDLHGLAQLPGLAVQRLMAEGYGFAGEGDWKTAAVVRAMKVISDGLPGGASFMEDYTYELNPTGQLVLGSHMLEICPSIAEGRPRLEVHPLGIGGKADPARLVFDARAGAAVNVALMDLGNRFRFLVNEVDAIKPPRELPKLPVARAVWKCRPDFKTAVGAWIHAGGAHHTGYSYAVTSEHIEDLAEIAGVEVVLIDEETRMREFRQQLRNNEIYYHIAPGLGRV
jgi:L-arabinose isomerase